MHFKHPELLYALFLLVIPLLVHLFQLRKFRKEKFTNVKFLKKASLQTRKSSQIKRWLVLLTRMLLLTSLIIAFAQPFLPASGQGLQEQESVIYLDNSYSMEARGPNGVLLKRSIHQLLEHIPEEQEFSFFTNDKEYKAVTKKSLRSDLQSLSFSPEQLDWKTALLKAENLFSERAGVAKNFIAISDFQHTDQENDSFAFNREFHHYLVQLKPESTANIAIDTAFVSVKNLNETELSLQLKASAEGSYEVPVSLYDGEKLLAKRTVILDENLITTTVFPLPADAIKQGRIQIEDPGLKFDNVLYFSINESRPIEVVSIGSGNPSFLQKIYQAPDFALQVLQENRIDHNVLSKADLIILNEPEELSPSLSSSISRLVQERSLLVIIPSDKADPQIYHQLFRNLNLPLYREKIEQEKQITEIAFSHPLFWSVFEEEIHNFQYPEVNTYYRLQRSLETILSFENGDPFLTSSQKVFLFTAALNDMNSNFKNSPLIVPTFFNFGNLSLSPTSHYYLLGSTNEVDLDFSLEKDEILKLSNSEESFIPLQQSFPNKVEIRLLDSPREAGHYEVLHNSTSIKTLSFNIDRSESAPNFRDLKSADNVEVLRNITHAFNAIESKTEINALWKWFVIFALFFLLTEMCILKLVK